MVLERVKLDDVESGVVFLPDPNIQLQKSLRASM
jgi:hypothetical protein